MNLVSINANAKVNFSLDIVGFTDNGYHSVEMIMQTIDIFDRLILYKPEAISDLREEIIGEILEAKKAQQDRNERKIAKGIPVKLPDPEDNIVFTCTNSFLPVDSKNDSYKAALYMKNLAGYHGKLGIHLRKRLPVGGGLGGGGADAAATLVGLNRLFELNLSCEQLMEIGAKIGSDVPFLVKGGTALATGTGTTLREIPSLKNGFLVILNPKIFVSTEEVYTNFDKMRLSPESHPDTQYLLECLKNKDIEEFAANMKNVLEKPAFQICPEIMALKKKVAATNPLGTVMSGSGSTVIAIYKTKEEALAVAKDFKEDGIFAMISDLSVVPKFGDQF